ncbi:uncharacterized protein LOC116449522 [Corvus moneduloides]|uniref:uncharacterized protein LOC116449522 n=1 Tax=Corvus moneduloides TaxID=1196302 RepID=UPI0013636E97|nr:uncharacterized protein LOC116449522 [Corvus moneduloides]
MDYLEYRLEDGLKTSAHAGAEPVGDGQATSQPMSTTEPQREDEGVSAGRTSPAPLLVPARKPGSHRRGPPKRKNKATGDKKSLESNDVLKQILKEMVQGGQGGCISLSLLLSLSSRGLSLHICTRRARHRGRDPWQPRGPAAAFTPCRAMEAEAVLKAAFPGGSSGSLAASAAGREAMPGTGTGDWQHDLDYLESRLDDGLKTSERAGAEPVGDGQATSQPMSTTEPQREDEGVSAGRTSPAPLLVPARKPGSHRRGPPKGKTQATELKKPHEPLRIMRQMLKEMVQGGQEANTQMGNSST